MLNKNNIKWFEHKKDESVKTNADFYGLRLKEAQNGEEFMEIFNEMMCCAGEWAVKHYSKGVELENNKVEYVSSEAIMKYLQDELN